MEHYSVIKQMKFAIFHNMVGPGGYHANNIRQAEKKKKKDRQKRQTRYDFTHMWNTKKLQEKIKKEKN